MQVITHTGQCMSPRLAIAHTGARLTKNLKIKIILTSPYLH